MDKAVMSVRMKQWAGIIQEAATSGLTKTEFCARKGIDRRQFFHWQKRIREYVLENNPELGQSRSRRKLLGKLDPATGEIVPCGKRGPKKKQAEEREEQVSASEYSKLRGQYEQSQTEATRLRLSLTEMEKELSDLRKQNQRMANTIQKIRGLIAE